MIPRPIRGLIDRLSGWAGPSDGASYPPLDVLKPVADDLWIVDSVIGRGAPVRMTVIRLAAGELLLHSPTRFTDHLRRQLEGIGRIRHLVAPNTAHWTFLPGWQSAFPDAVTWLHRGSARAPRCADPALGSIATSRILHPRNGRGRSSRP